jgi:hypothetical protein
VLVVTIWAGCLAVVSAKTARPAVSLSKDQRDLYAAFLDKYIPALMDTANKPAFINLSNATAVFDVRRELKENGHCFDGLAFSGVRKQVHTLDASLFPRRDIRIIGSTQQAAVRAALIHGSPSAIDGLNANLLQVSEIAFDAMHRFAAIRYTFSCGNVCGRGGVVIFEKKGDTWNESRGCVGWIS